MPLMKIQKSITNSLFDPICNTLPFININFLKKFFFLFLFLVIAMNLRVSLFLMGDATKFFGEISISFGSNIFICV